MLEAAEGPAGGHRRVWPEACGSSILLLDHRAAHRVDHCEDQCVAEGGGGRPHFWAHSLLGCWSFSMRPASVAMAEYMAFASPAAACLAPSAALRR